MIRADTFYMEKELNEQGISQGEFLELRMAGLRGIRRGGGTVAWYDGADVQKFQRIVNKVLTKTPTERKKVSAFAKQPA